MRQIVLDTETTGLDPLSGHRIIEIGCVELRNRRLTGNNLHLYINPERDIDEGALEVHGITREFLADKPTFEQIAEEFMTFVDGAELVIHNAPFDIAFLNAEVDRLGGQGADSPELVDAVCDITDSLVLARQKHPGQKNSLDALCRRYMVDNSQRDLHGALLDAEILADVYLLMTGGQAQMFSSGVDQEQKSQSESNQQSIHLETEKLRVVQARPEELAAHEAMLELMDQHSDGQTLWRR